MGLISKIFTRTNKIDTTALDAAIETWKDEEVLFNFSRFLGRVGIGVQYVQDDNGFITHQILEVLCGDALLQSEPKQLDWPMEPVKFPEELKKDLN